MPIVINTGRINVPLRTYDKNWKVVYVDGSNNEIVLGDGTATDNNRMITATFTRKSLRYGTGFFQISLNNEGGYYNQVLTNAVEIRAYADQTSSVPTNQIFEGKIQSVKHSLTEDDAFIMNIYGVMFPQLADMNITVDFSSGATAIAAIQYIIDNFFSGVFTYVNLNPNMTGTIYGQYVDQIALNVIADILKQVEYDGYIDFTNDIHSFPEGGNINTREKITYGDNMLAYSDIGQDFVDKKNRVIVYGSNSEGLLLVATKNNTTSQSESWVKSTVITAGNIITTTTLAQKAQTELTFLDEVPTIGTMAAANGLPTLVPGQSLQCSNQFANITGFYNSVSITDQFFQDTTWITQVDVSRLDKTNSVQIKDVENKVNSISAQNINGMTNTAFILTFEDTSGLASLGSLQVSNSRLSIATGSSGTATTILVELDDDATSFEARGKPNDDCAVSYFQVSNDGGVSYNNSNEQYNLVGGLNTRVNFTTTGNKIVVKITLVADATYLLPELENFEILTR